MKCLSQGLRLFAKGILQQLHSGEIEDEVGKLFGREYGMRRFGLAIMANEKTPVHAHA